MLGNPGKNVGEPGLRIDIVHLGRDDYTLDGKPPLTVEAGEVLFVPYGTPHSAKNVGSVKAVELATYIVEKGKPLLKLSD